MCLGIQPAIEQDAKKRPAQMKTVAAEHAFAVQAVKSGELLQGEFTEGVRAHPESPQEQPVGRIVALVPVAVAQSVEKGLERLLVGARYLHAD